MSDDVYIEFLFWERYKSKDFFQESDEGLHLIFQIMTMCELIQPNH